jgi:enolase
MAKIKKIFAYEIIDSRGIPTLEGRLELDNGQMVISSIPAGTSVGKYEAIEIRDNDNKRFDGQGVSLAATYINDVIAPKLVGVNSEKLLEVDAWLIKADGTKNKSRLGGNTVLLVSELMAKAGALTQNLPLFKYINQVYEKAFKEKITLEKIPSPIFNIINGGKHANNNLEIQEFQVVASSAMKFAQAYQIGVELFHQLKKVIAYRNGNTSVGQEGGYTPFLSTNIDALEMIMEAINSRGYKIGIDVFLGMDLAADYFYNNETYRLKDFSKPFKTNEFIEFLIKTVKKYSILILEDPLSEDDWSGWANLNSKVAKEIYLVGDDLLATNKERLEKAIKMNACTTILIKPNQIGTISETLEVINLARKNNINYIVSHRSGETNDSFIADFAVGIQADFVKFGAPCRGERVAKYNRLWQIEREELK